MTLSSHLTHIGQRPDHNINLIDAALGLAQYSNNLLDVRPHQRHVDRLILDAKFYIGSDTETLSIVLESVREIIAKRYGFVSEMKSDALSDATLISTVIETRRGSALTLCLLYAHVLENLDQNVEIIDFPARPLVRIIGPTETVIIDPYHGGKWVRSQDLREMLKDGAQDAPFGLKPLAKREVLIRLQDVIKLDLLRRAAPEAAISVIEAGLLIDPKNARLWRELGLLHSRLDHIEDSIAALKHFLNLATQDPHRYSASQLLQQLTQKLKLGQDTHIP